MNKTEIGRTGEQAAARLYERNGFKILVKNFHNVRGKIFGEIDFIALKERHLHFVEIKTRSSENFGAALEALTRTKQQKIARTAQLFLQQLPCFQDYQLHFDLAAVAFDPFDKSPGKITIHSDVIDDI